MKPAYKLIDVAKQPPSSPELTYCPCANRPLNAHMLAYVYEGACERRDFARYGKRGSTRYGLNFATRIPRFSAASGVASSLSSIPTSYPFDSNTHCVGWAADAIGTLSEWTVPKDDWKKYDDAEAELVAHYPQLFMSPSVPLPGDPVRQFDASWVLSAWKYVNQFQRLVIPLDCSDESRTVTRKLSLNTGDVIDPSAFGPGLVYPDRGPFYDGGGINIAVWPYGEDYTHEEQITASGCPYAVYNEWYGPYWFYDDSDHEYKIAYATLEEDGDYDLQDETILARTVAENDLSFLVLGSSYKDVDERKWQSSVPSLFARAKELADDANSSLGTGDTGTGVQVTVTDHYGILSPDWVFVPSALPGWTP